MEAEREAQRQRELEAARKLAEAEQQRATVEQQRAEEGQAAARTLRQRARYLMAAAVGILLVALVVLTGPFRSLLVPAQRRQVDEFIVRANEFIAERRRSGTGFG